RPRAFHPHRRRRPSPSFLPLPGGRRSRRDPFLSTTTKPTQTAALLSLSPSAGGRLHGPAAPSGAMGIRARRRWGYGVTADPRMPAGEAAWPGGGRELSPAAQAAATPLPRPESSPDLAAAAPKRHHGLAGARRGATTSLSRSPPMPASSGGRSNEQGPQSGWRRILSRGVTLLDLAAAARAVFLPVHGQLVHPVVPFYVKLGLVSDAEMVFDGMPVRGIISWNNWWMGMV
ncbi:unnamed protein product, partial [Urochloa humidicola]